MDIESLTIGQGRELAKLFASGQRESTTGPWEVGTPYLIRTVTMTLTGRLVAAYPQELVLDDAAWIADTGRFADVLASGTLNEVEPFPAGRVIVGRGAVVDAAEWQHELPRVQQ